MRHIVGVNERGMRVGEDHQNAKLSNHEVDLIRALREEHGMTYAQIAEKFEIAKETVADIVKCRRRAQVPVAWRAVTSGVILG